MNKSWDDVEAPKAMPVGSYLFVVKGLPRHDKSTKKGTEYYEFTLQPIQALEDVDEEALEEYGGLRDKDGNPRVMRTTFYLTEDAIYRLKEFTEACGVDPTGKTPAQTINELPNCQVIGHVKHSAGRNDRIYANVESFTRFGSDDDE